MSKRLASILEGIVISLIATAILGILASWIGSLPDLSLNNGSEVLLGPPYVILLIFFVGIYVIFTTFTSGLNVLSFRLGRICNQFRYFSYIDHFASNGIAKYDFVQLEGIHCILLSLENFNMSYDSDPTAFTTSADCGIIFAKKVSFHPFSKGFLISDKNTIKFSIRGKVGGEQIGIAMKNINGHEQKYSLSTLSEKQIMRDAWTTFEIDLGKYAHVVRSEHGQQFLENFSIFTNSHLSGSEKQQLFVSYIKFTK